MSDPVLDPEGILGRVLAERYRIVRFLGRGGMGSIYLATQLQLERDVVVKTIRSKEDEDAEARFQREARSLSRLSHPNVVQIFDHGRDAATGLLFIVMEAVPGINLAQYLKEHGALPFASFAAIATQLASGVGEAHRQGLIHRDLKPSNIMLSSIEGGLRLKLLDFGLSKSMGGESLTGTGQTVGTCKYMAPEQFGDGTIDARADVYAMGVVLYEMLAGRRPFEADDPQTQLNMQLAGKAPSLGKLLGAGHPAPPELVSLIERCLAADRNKRPQDAGEVARLLDHALDLSSKRRAAVILPSGIPDSIPSTTHTGSSMRSNDPMSQTRSSTRAEVGVMAGMATAIMGIGALIIVLLLLVIGFGWYSMSKQDTTAQTTEIRADQVTAFRKEGLQALTAKDYDKAVTMFQVAVEKAPEDSDIKDLLRLAIEARDRAAQAPPPAPEPAVAMVEPEPEPEPEPQPSKPSPSPSPSPKPTPKPVAQAPKPKPTAEVSRPAPAPVVKTGTIFIASAPKGLAFSIPGVGDGVTPASLMDVPAGTFTVTFYDGGRAIHSTSVEVKAGEGALIDVDLADKMTPAPAPAPEPVVAAPAPAPEPAPAPSPEPVVQPATMASEVAKGDLEVSSPNVFGEVWAGGVRCGPAPVVCKGLPAGSVTIEIRSGKKVLRTQQATVVADTRSHITVR